MDKLIVAPTFLTFYINIPSSSPFLQNILIFTIVKILTIFSIFKTFLVKYIVLFYINPVHFQILSTLYETQIDCSDIIISGLYQISKRDATEIEFKRLPIFLEKITIVW